VRCLNFTLIVATVLILSGCNGGGKNTANKSDATPTTTTPTLPILVGNFIDFPISGLNYSTATLSGVTPTAGTWNYRCPSTVCETIFFLIGGITLGQATAAPNLSLREWQGGMENGTLSELSLRRGQFLIALDADADPTNGITLSTELAKSLSARDLLFSSATFDADFASLLEYLRNDTRLSISYRAGLQNPTKPLVRALLEQAEALARGVFIETPTGSSPTLELKKYVVKLPDSALAAYYGNSDTLRIAYVKGLRPALGGGLTIVPGGTASNFELRTVSSRGITVSAPKYFDGIVTRAANVIVTAEPNAAPSISSFTLTDNSAQFKSLMPLKSTSDVVFSGRPIALGLSGSDGARNLDESLKPRNPEFDQAGLDNAGITMAKDGSSWVCDRRGPFLMRFDTQGRSQERYGPLGEAGAVPGVTRRLPALLESRQAGLGCGGLALRPTTEDVLMAVAAPLDIKGRTAQSAKLLRLISFKASTGVSRLYAIPVAATEISFQVLDLETLSEDKILAIVRYRSSEAGSPWQWEVRTIDLSLATELTNKVLTVGPNAGLELEYGSATEIASSGIKLATTQVILNLRAVGWTFDNPEGLARVDAQTLIVMAQQNGGVTSRIRNGNPNLSVEEHQVDQSGLITPRATGSSVLASYEIIPTSFDQRQIILWSIKLRSAIP